jgi:hypothetical protein
MVTQGGGHQFAIYKWVVFFQVSDAFGKLDVQALQPIGFFYLSHIFLKPYGCLHKVLLAF